MRLERTYNPLFTNGLRQLLLLIFVLVGLQAQAQIKIGGSVYGGGNAGDVKGNTTVTLRAGDLNKVFGGARMADIDGRAFVHIDGANASDYMLINYVYAGNDISGTVGKTTETFNQTADLPQLEKATLNGVDKSWDAIVRITDNADHTQKTYIGQLFGGGNGDYDYDNVDGVHTIYKKGTQEIIATTTTSDFHIPNLGKTYLEIMGGSIVYAFGGGNNATVNDMTIIHVENPSEVVYSIKDANNVELLTDDRINEMGYNPGFTYAKSPDFQIGSFFGGNNRAPMAIRPRWNLLAGKIRNLYSGGNEGDMTSLEGILIEIPEVSTLKVDNIYGGCRKANVIPGGNPNDPQETTPFGNSVFPRGFAAHLTLKGGDINNVYGGNDISGKVFGGTTVGIYTSVRGNVYGGGNGSYPYTDNADLKDDPVFGEVYYNPAGFTSSVDALNAFRPNAEQVSLFVSGYEDPDNHEWTPTIIHGSVYLGGNSATLATQRLLEPIVELKIGSHVFIDNVYLGNNGYDMVQTHTGNPATYEREGILRTYQRQLNSLKSDGWTSVDYSGNNGKFTQMNLKDETTFAKYMDGCAMPLMPSVVFVDYEKDKLTDYDDYTTYIGSFYCGGNVGSMIVPGKTTINFIHRVIVYDKLVGGCNNAYVPVTDFNAAFSGGLIGSTTERELFVNNETGKIKDRLELNLNGLKIQPKRWKKDLQDDYILGANGLPQLEWNTVSAATGENVTAPTEELPTEGIIGQPEDVDRRFKGGNIYGGCYKSGYVNGNVVININAPILDLTGPYAVFDRVLEDEEGEARLNMHDQYHILERRSGVIRDEQAMDVLGTSLNVFGGGYGLQSEIKGSTTINLNKGYAFQVYGGGEKGAVGMHTSVENGKFRYVYNPDYSTTVNLNGLANLPGVPKGADGDHVDMAEAEFIYGGGFEGLIAGNTVVNLNNGRVFDSFGGSCNADILGHTETYIGSNGFPYIRDDVYGGNDLGGRIYGENKKSFWSRVRDNDDNTDNGNAILEHVHGYDENKTGKADVLFADAYVEYSKGRVDSIFGGCCGEYDYKKRIFSSYTDANGDPLEGFTKPRMDNAFVNFRPVMNSNPYNRVLRIFGAGQGFPKEKEMNLLQNRSYVLIDIPDGMSTTFQNMEVFGAGPYSGLGMGVTPTKKETPDGSSVDENPDLASAIIDLFGGRIKDVFGASYKEGVTRRTVVNVPEGSTIHVNRIFGGGYGITNDVPCDVYEANVNYHSSTAVTSGNPDDVVDNNQKAGGIYGGNNNFRRTLYAKVNIDAKVVQNKQKDYTARVFGAGYGKDTWAQYTEVNLLNGANVYEAYGGGYGGMVLNKESVIKGAELNGWDLTIGAGYSNNDGGLDNPLVIMNKLGVEKTNTNVNIEEGAWVGNYCYGGGLGADATVSGKTYIGLHGGGVSKDLYAAGTSGAVLDKYGVAKDDKNDNDFVATTYAYIEGGTVRNVYGGGWEGSVGKHEGELDASSVNDIPGVTNVVIGIRKDQATLPDGYGFLKGVPAILRNAYGGGEGGAVYGTTHLTLNNGYIGYEHFNATPSTHTDLPCIKDGDDYYQEKIHDETYSDETHPKGSPNYRLEDCGNLYGGGYDDNSNVDESHVTVYGGKIRNSVYGGGEIATIGRGSTKEEGAKRTLDGFYVAGSTKVEIYNGHVLRDVYGGGKGFNLLGYGHKADRERRYTDGYVFGQTAVYIYGGEIGTTEGVADGYGNVFGGGNIGYVYSPGFIVPKTKTEKTNHPEGSEGCSPNHWYYYGSDDNLTEDCKVIVSPRLQIKADGSNIEYDEVIYKPYDYVPTAYLNTLPKKDKDATVWPTVWQNLITEENGNDRGVMIHNAVFAGGNVSSNSDQTYANATTVFGNTTAVLNDVYHRDFITVGTEHTGGLYGGGNLSVVDGYRELNITNYGTDYFALESQISIEKYRTLSNRERAYFKLKYECKATTTFGTGDAQKTYTKDQVIEEDEYLKLVDAYGDAAKNAFTPYGFCSIYAGRLLNTIQRAELCGVYGSRLVLQGAKDRVADVGDATEYTINRVGELSLNLQRSVISADQNDSQEKLHGNYFGIYSVVNYLGNLTSDVRFNNSNHPYRDKDGVEVSGKTYYQYKAADPTSSNRNIGSSYNQVALASGVFLEITREKASTNAEKEYGYITGVVELDLINVKQSGVGGGFVYAKNVHGEPTYDSSITHLVLSPYNKQTGNEVCTYKQYRYPGTLQTFETSGNFIHPTKRIIDDCYPTNNAYDSAKSPYSEAHYWYVKGNVYLYDVKVSAYTGSATAYPKEVKIPLTITAASHGKLQLLNVKPNLYAYKMPGATETADPVVIGSINDANNKPIDKVTVNNEHDSYSLNDVITWWDWNNLSSTEKRYFVKNTYVNCITCTIDGKEYEPGTYVMDQSTYSGFSKAFTYTNDSGDAVTVNTTDGDYSTKKADIFRSSNNIGHNTGYALTFDMDTPSIWDDWYSPITGASTYTVAANGTVTTSRTQVKADGYREGPTYTPTTPGVYGQRQYDKGEIITEDTYLNNKTGSGEQATVEKAYVATKSVTYNNKSYNKGAAISQTEYEALDATTKVAFGSAYVCINTVKLDDNNYLLLNDLVAESEYLTLATDIKASLTPAYTITKKGGYGGKEFTSGTNYSAISAWCSLSNTDRGNFSFNYDALDLLSDPNYLDFYDASAGQTKTIAQAYKQPYSDQVDVEYEAVFQAEKYGNDHHTTGDNPQPITYLSYDGGSTKIASSDNPRISNTVFETQVKNDQRHYTRVSTTNANEDVYIANQNFDADGTPYGKGQLVSADVYTSNSGKVDRVTIPTAGIHYYCYEAYGSVSKEAIIEEGAYNNLPNDQKYFIIQGKEPTGVTTLYVSSESDIKDVTKEKIITAIYQYTYYEDADEGGIKLTNELHVVNIHLELESGVPRIGVLSPPATVLPGYTIGLNAPKVDPGLYEPLGNGWEIFTDPDDAENHRNGEPFDNSHTPVYWYQNEKAWVAFYSKNYLGKTYSNPVPIRVANYHDLDAVMNDKEHHMYVDHPGAIRNPKIYIDNRDCISDPSKSELDLLKDLYDLSLLTTPAASGALQGHAVMDSHVKGCADMDFILNSDVSPKAYTTWTPIGNDTQCFEGTLHGDGYTISDLSNSLFGKLCGNVYNLGVTGSFTGAGIVDTGDGYVENCWIDTSGSPNGTVMAVFGSPSDNATKQIVNCYYDKEKNYTAGPARGMAEKDFHNGTVAYNLNGFYLNKRYYDHEQGSTGKAYNYLKNDPATGSLTENMLTGHYPSDYAIYPLPEKGVSNQNTGKWGYVEERYAYPDFIYAGGTIPETAESRLRTVTTGEGANTTTTTYYSPIWPDDYIYFGQTLTYRYDESHPHQKRPSRIMKSGGRLLTDAGSNRVYRAPAYFGNEEKATFHYNPQCIMAAYPKKLSELEPLEHQAYPGMTAVDFAGHSDKVGGSVAYNKDWSGNFFFQPLLDDDGLLSISNNGETNNLLIYAPSEAANKATYDVLNKSFTEPAFADYYEPNTYGRVAVAETYTIFGHLVQSNLTTKDDKYSNDHLLVDKESFNCPIAYTMGAGRRMWYQRAPDKYVTVVSGSNSKGWENISLPFEVKLVSTQEKGELTHFYNHTTQNNLIGHEYWLREYDGGALNTPKTEFIAKFISMTAAEDNPDKDLDKEYNNQFLWDYYYNKNNNNQVGAGDDRNGEDYKEYYNTAHTYKNYPLQKPGTPYLIGFPGISYFEFDLSGEWMTETTASPAPKKLDQQIITFASDPAITIVVSDGEINNGKITKDGYVYVPNYMNKTFESEGESYLLNGDGDCFVKNAAGATVSAFRPYIVEASSPTRGTESGNTKLNGKVERVVFENDYPQDFLPKGNPSVGLDDGTLIVSAKRKMIAVESQLHYTTDVRIVTPAGVTLASYTIQPTEYVETRVANAGVYIVYADNGRYVKKIIVR